MTGRELYDLDHKAQQDPYYEIAFQEALDNINVKEYAVYRRLKLHGK